MPTIHIATPPDGQKHELEESEVYPKWQAGAFPEGSLYWTKGMAGWEPLSGFIDTVKHVPVPVPPVESSDAAAFIAPAAIAPVDPNAPLNPYAAPAFEPVAMSRGNGGYAFTSNPWPLTNLLTVFLGVYLLITLISLSFQISQYQMLGRGFSNEEGAANDARISAVSTISIIAFFITAIVFAMWIYRAAVNSRGFGARGMRDTPGWSVGWYFVPIMHLVRPYQHMKEIWQVSADPENWIMQKGSAVLGVWWTCWLLTAILPKISGAFFKSASTPADFQVATVISIFSVLSGVAVTIAAIVLVRTLTQRQAALVARGVD